MTHDDAERKSCLIYSGFVKYFPKAMAEVALVSKTGNDQHNPGEPLYWNKAKSRDELNSLQRHLLDAGTRDDDGQRHSAKVAWRAMANLEREIEREEGYDYNSVTNKWEKMPMTWDAWGMFTSALEQYNDEDDCVVDTKEPEPDSEPPQTVWPEDHPLKFDVELMKVPATPEWLERLDLHRKHVKGEFITIPRIAKLTAPEWLNADKTLREKMNILLTLPQAHASFALMEACTGCGASKIKHLFCLHCGRPNMARCPNGDKPCTLCRGHAGWVEELKP